MGKVQSKRKNLSLHKVSSFLVILLIGTSLLIAMHPSIHANPSLTLTVNTDKQIYNAGEKVAINGTLTSNGVPIPNSIVAIEIRDRADLPFTFRTRPTGTTNKNWDVNYTELFPCDSNGNPKYSFTIGATLWIRFTVKNYDNVSHNVLTAISFYDAANVPLGAWYPYRGSIGPGQSITMVFMADKIPNNAKPGNAAIYGNLYSDFPKNGGFPYCLEKSVAFTITTTTSSTLNSEKEVYTTSTEAMYNLTFKLASTDVRVGNYTIYVSAQYQNETTTNTATFQAVLMGDLNNDLKVDMIDIGIVCLAYGSKPGDPNWNPIADLNGDEKIDMIDIGFVCLDYGKTGT